jgi:hypothetical protein
MQPAEAEPGYVAAQRWDVRQPDSRPRQLTE